jgi:flagellar hook assembly protein FlgD
MLLAAGAVIVVLVVLFPLEWVQVPSITITTERQAFSPNGDGNVDQVVLIYGLSQDATVNIQVLSVNEQVIRALAEDELQASGQHSVLWDGRSGVGAVVADGEYTVRIEAKGTARSTTKSASVLVDNTPPILRLANLPNDLKVGDEDLLIEGATEPGSTLWLNDQPQSITVGSSGGFSIRYRLREGENFIELSAIDPSGNAASVTRVVTLVLRPPEIVLDNPPDGVWINQRLLSVQGRAAPDARVLVNGKQAVVDDNGRFNVDVLLEEGENVVAVEATDAVGNETVVERRVFLKLQPPPITINSVQEGAKVSEPSLLVAGQTEAGAVVRLNGQEVAVDTQGGFQGVVNLVEGVNLIRVEAIDQANNAAVTTRSVTYTTATSRPVGNTLRTALMAGGVGAALVLALWILLGGLYGPNALSMSTDEPFLSSNPYDGQDVRFTLELARPAQVTVHVFNSQDEPVATLMSKRRRRAGLHTMEWNGLDDMGRMVSDGAYDIQASASTIFTTVTNRLSVIKTSERVPQFLRRREAGYIEPAGRIEGHASQGQSVGWE